jgi:uncharacterized protein YutD
MEFNTFTESELDIIAEFQNAFCNFLCGSIVVNEIKSTY